MLPLLFAPSLCSYGDRLARAQFKKVSWSWGFAILRPHEPATLSYATRLSSSKSGTGFVAATSCRRSLVGPVGFEPTTKGL